MIETIKLAGLSCQHCVKRVEAILADLEGVQGVTVDLNKNIARVRTIDHLSLDMVNQVFEGSNYQALSIEKN